MPEVVPVIVRLVSSPWTGLVFDVDQLEGVVRQTGKIGLWDLIANMPLSDLACDNFPVDGLDETTVTGIREGLKAYCDANVRFYSFADELTGDGGVVCALTTGLIDD